MTKHHLHKLSQGVQSPKFLLFSIFIARKRSLGQGNMFTPVCHSVHGGVAWSRRGVPGPGGPGGDTFPDGYCCGRYASYWNAFLLFFENVPI